MTEGSFYSTGTDHWRIASDLTLGFGAAWILHDSKAPWLGYSILGIVVLLLIVAQKRVWVRENGISWTYFLRPFQRHHFIPIDTVRSVERKRGHYTASSFARIRYARAAKTSTVDVIVSPSDWPRLIDILKKGKSSIAVIDS